MILSTILYIFLLIQVHSWYPSYCCKEGDDCNPVPCQDFKYLGNGSVEYKGYVFQKDKIGFSPDGKCHACIWNNQARCAFFPGGA